MLTVFALKTLVRVFAVLLALKNPGGGFVLTVFALKNPGRGVFVALFSLKNPGRGFLLPCVLSKTRVGGLC